MLSQESKITSPRETEYRLGDEACGCDGDIEADAAVVDGIVRGLPKQWLFATEGAGTWSCYDVVGHLIHAEVADWIPRARMILEHGESRPFEPFDREAMKREKKRPIAELLRRFAELRAQNLRTLKGMRLREKDLARMGTHPQLGRVTLAQLIATWAAHDMTYVSQVCRVLARQYEVEVGPWKAFLGVLNR